MSVQGARLGAHSVAGAFEAYRVGRQEGWGLAWYLSYELCRRYYVSHGIVPHVLDHEGVGYYGISVDQVACTVNRASGVANALPHGSLGRFTAAGNAENWRTGQPGDHGCNLVERAAAGEPLPELVQAALRHLDLDPVASRAHTYCHHKRRGESYVLVFEVAALVALLHEGRVAIWNSTLHTLELSRQYDPDHAPKAGAAAESPDYFLFDRLGCDQQRQLLIRGDGRVILPEGHESLWGRYMRGESANGLALWVARLLGL